MRSFLHLHLLFLSLLSALLPLPLFSTSGCDRSGGCCCGGGCGCSGEPGRVADATDMAGEASDVVAVMARCCDTVQRDAIRYDTPGDAMGWDGVGWGWWDGMVWWYGMCLLAAPSPRYKRRCAIDGHSSDAMAVCEMEREKRRQRVATGRRNVFVRDSPPSARREEQIGLRHPATGDLVGTVVRRLGSVWTAG